MRSPLLLLLRLATRGQYCHIEKAGGTSRNVVKVKKVALCLSEVVFTPEDCYTATAFLIQRFVDAKHVFEAETTQIGYLSKIRLSRAIAQTAELKYPLLHHISAPLSPHNLTEV